MQGPKNVFVVDTEEVRSPREGESKTNVNGREVPNAENFGATVVGTKADGRFVLGIERTVTSEDLLDIFNTKNPQNSGPVGDWENAVAQDPEIAGMAWAYYQDPETRKAVRARMKDIPDGVVILSKNIPPVRFQ